MVPQPPRFPVLTTQIGFESGGKRMGWQHPGSSTLHGDSTAWRPLCADDAFWRGVFYAASPPKADPKWYSWICRSQGRINWTNSIFPAILWSSLNNNLISFIHLCIALNFFKLLLYIICAIFTAVSPNHSWYLAHPYVLIRTNHFSKFFPPRVPFAILPYFHRLFRFAGFSFFSQSFPSWWKFPSFPLYTTCVHAGRPQPVTLLSPWRYCLPPDTTHTPPLFGTHPYFYYSVVLGCLPPHRVRGISVAAIWRLAPCGILSRSAPVASPWQQDLVSAYLCFCSTSDLLFGVHTYSNQFRSEVRI